MGGKSSSAPAPPDPYATASAQSQFDKQTAAYNAALNRTNTYTPLGSSTYKITGTDPTTKAPIYAQTISLSPEQQALYNQQLQQNQVFGNINNGMLSQIASAYANPINANSTYPIQNQVQQQGKLQTGVGQTAFQQGVDPTQYQTNVQAGPLQNSVAGGNIQGQINTSGIPGIPGASDLSGFTKQAQDAAYQQATQYLDPQFDRQQQQLETQLRNQGATPGSQAWENAMLDFNNTKQRAYADARQAAVSQGLAEQQGLYGMGANTNAQLYGQAANNAGFANAAQAQQFAQAMQNAGLFNTAQAQQFGEGMQNAGLANDAATARFGQEMANAGLYNQAAANQFQQGQQNAALNNSAVGQQFGMGLENASLNNNASGQKLQQAIALQNAPVNAFNALRSQSQVSMPQFQGTYTPTANAPNYMGAVNNAYQGQLANYNAGVGSNNALMGGLFNLGGAVAGALPWSSWFSDERLKRDVRRVGETPAGVPLYAFKYLGSDVEQVGVLAQELAETQPLAVAEDESGYLKVDYRRVR